jgi:DNA-directed RNA polymerase specialized sigma24 family protein
MAMALLGYPSDAEEVTQDVFLSVWCNSVGFDPLKASFAT